MLHLGSRQYFSVNQTGITVLEQLRTHRTVGELVAVVTAEYDVSEADAEHTIRAFIERCVESDLLSEFR